MPREFFSIAPVNGVTKDDLDLMVAEINQRLTDITLALVEAQGEDGFVPTFKNGINLGGSGRVMNAARSRSTSAIPTRGELMDRALYRSSDGGAHITGATIEAQAGVKVPWAQAPGYVPPIDQIEGSFVTLTTDQTIPSNNTFTGNNVFSGTTTISGTIAVTGKVVLTPVTPAAIAGNTNDYAIGSATFFRISATAPFNITGFVAGTNGQMMLLVNVGANAITLTNQDAASAAANRILTGTGASIVMAQDDTVALIYDTTSTVWRVWNVH